VTEVSDSRAPLDAEDVRQRMGAAGIAWPEPVLLATVGSTNDELEARARAGAPEGTVVVADEQTHGRGRLDRSWVSPPGAGLWMSALVRVGEVPPDRWSLLSLAAGVAAVDALAEGCGVRAELKWPNDVVVIAAACGGDSGPRKIGGILSHTVGPDGIILGIGLNVSLRSDELPVPQASSVLLEGGRPDRAALLVALMAALTVRVEQWRTDDPAMLADYRRLCSSIGRLVDIELPDGRRVSGMVSGVDDDGHLLVSDGEATARITSGDVIHATI
jgi:BirA family biotin operon repressor/biotin-[acetyl-CoA-carboxylase] ligase